MHFKRIPVVVNYKKNMPFLTKNINIKLCDIYIFEQNKLSQTQFYVLKLCPASMKKT